MRSRFLAGGALGLLAVLGQSGALAGPEEPRGEVPELGGQPNMNGVWQAVGHANWNLEANSAQGLDEFWRMGAMAAVPATRSVVRGGTIPYRDEALEQREDNRANWPQEDPEAKCYSLGVPRVTYHELPFQIVQSPGDDMLMSYAFADTNRIVYMTEDIEPLPADAWMGRSYGRWEEDVLVVTTINQNGRSWLDRAGNHASNELVVTERFEMLGPDHMWYEATLEDPQTFTESWTIEMPLYRHIEPDAQLLEHNCVPFSENLLYQDLLHPDD